MLGLTRQKLGWTATLLAMLLGARDNTLCAQVSSWAPTLSVQRWAYRFPLMYELWRECYSLAFRIRHLHETGVTDEGLGLNCTPGLSVRLQGAAVRAHSESIQNLRQRYPWATLVDCAVYLQGFDMGVVFLLDNPDFYRGTRQTAESAIASGSPVSDKPSRRQCKRQKQLLTLQFTSPKAP